jgi:O-antigen/teichoic acid export membrane protein
VSSTRTSLLFSFLEKYALLVVALGGAMIMSRLLTPEETGVYSVGAVLLGMAQVLRDFGVGQYLVQERELDEDKLRAVLATSFLFAWGLAAAIAGMSLPVAWFYGEPRLAPLLQLLSLNFLLLPFSAISLPMLRRQMRFGAICAINLTHGLCHFAVSLTLAWRGVGFMSLAWASVAATLAGSLLGLWLRPAGLPWLPARAGMGKVIAFGAYATGGNLIDEAGVAAPDLIIGKLLGMDAVGIFSKALGVLGVFNKAITSAVSPVVYPLYAATARADGDVNRAYLRTVSYMTAFAWPFFACVALMALPILRLLYGGQWDAAAPLIRIMCFSSAIYSMSSMARYLFVATGQVKVQARLDALAVPIRIVLLLLAAPFGLAAIAWAVVAGALARAWLTMRYLTAGNRIAVADVAGAAARSVPLTAISVLAPACLLLAPDASVADTAAAAGAALLLWVAGIVLVRHPLLDEINLARRKLAAALSP